MAIEYSPPLAIHFVWNFADNDKVKPILDLIRKSFARNVDCPFSRGLNFPLFFYSSENPCISPANLPQQKAATDIVFIFASVNTLGHETWKSYANHIPLSDTFRIVPITIDRDGLGHGNSGNLKSLNFLRLYEWPEDLREQWAVLSLAHEICRYVFFEINPKSPGKHSSVKIFLSHSKAGDTGRLHAEAIYKFIDRTNMSRFFDATEISPGFKFDEEITKHIKEATLVAIGSDTYSSRYWCQREILCAKQNDRPIIAVDCLQDYEDRVFPAGSNIPCVHVPPDTPISEKDILRILLTTIVETIRYYYAQKSLKYYQEQKWIDGDCAIISRPPEIRQTIELINTGQKKVCYPEPSLYSEEADWLSHLGVEAFTPLWNSDEDRSLDSYRIGISISDNPLDGYATHHMHSDNLKRLSQDIARHLLARSGTIIYGGDLRKDGFTEFILDEAITLINRLQTDNIHVENHLAWPLYISSPEVVAWRAKYNDVIKTVEHVIPDDISKDIDKDTFIAPNGTNNRYIWSRSLTEMRKKSVESSHARICAGGKLSGYNGKMPGVLEEIMIAIEKKKPIFLLGAYGGVVGKVCKTISSKTVIEQLTENWQITNNEGYFELQKRSKTEGNNANYIKIKNVLEQINIVDLAKHCGLKPYDYQRLMISPFIDECVHIILKGLKNITSQ